jgi:galactofuranosylgalactofuranosylrhamnosyl-N-acetylglucosaminyl-diphospho-decaprenol beta-1,5/1,6-galactofuranosyltransferase
VFAGPERLHAELPTKLAEINTFRKQWPDAVIETDRDAFPVIRRTRPPRRGKDDTEVPRKLSLLVTAAMSPVRQLTAIRPMAEKFPEGEVAGMDAKWYRLAEYDSAVVSMPDGTGAALYQRDPRHFRDLLKRTIDIHRRLNKEWPELSARYREALGSITSPEEWEKTFAASIQEPKK